MEETIPAAVNPYQSPEAAVAPVESPAVQGGLTESMLIYLKGASPWLRFIGIVGFVYAGLIALTGIAYIPFFPMVGHVVAEIPGFEWAAVLGAGMILLTTGWAALVFIPSLFLYRFGEKIRSYLRTGVDQYLEQAFRNNKSFWKFAGVICIITVAFVPVVLILSIIAVVVSALV
ncbi:MAG: hypothetical protein FWC64_12060 [Treponema sp.]|nr:hypothetical protein [Treponema sp.]